MIGTATKEELRQLLSLFPIDALKREWPDTDGSKDEVCVEVAAMASNNDVIDFVDRNFAARREISRQDASSGRDSEGIAAEHRSEAGLRNKRRILGIPCRRNCLQGF